MSEVETSSNQPIWNPNVSVNLSLLFSPIFGTYLHYQNWKILGEVARAKAAKIWFIISIVALALDVLTSILPSTSTSRGSFSACLLIVWYFAYARKQVKYVKERFGNTYSKKSLGMPIGIGFASLLVIILAFGLPSLLGDSDEVKMVKDGTLQSCPQKTVEQMVSGFMAKPSWESGAASDGSEFVNISGDISYSGKDVRAMLQFIIDKQQSTFQFRAIEVNGVPMNELIAMALLQKMCAE